MDDSRYFNKFNLKYSDMTVNIYYNILQTQWSYVLNEIMVVKKFSKTKNVLHIHIPYIYDIVVYLLIYISI